MNEEPDALGKNEVMENCLKSSLNKHGLVSAVRNREEREGRSTRDSFLGGERELVDARAMRD